MQLLTANDNNLACPEQLFVFDMDMGIPYDMKQ